MMIVNGESHVDIPKKYKACIYDVPGTLSTKVVELDTPEPGPGEVLINLTHSGVCHSDMGIMMNSWKMLPHPTQPGQVGGHEGVGKVVKLGDGVESGIIRIGDRVGVKWINSACLSCLACLEGSDGCCFNQKISGYYSPGTFQQFVLAPGNYVTKIPDNLSSADAAPMLCAGITTYAALRKCQAKSGQWVVISGAGGGLGHIACQLAAHGMAMRVIGIDHGSKEKLVRDSGAEAFVDITKFDDESIAKEVIQITGGQGASAVIVCTASNKAYDQSLDFLRFGGTMPEHEPMPIAKSYPAALVLKQQTITAVAVGNRQDAAEVMDFAARGIVKTHYRLEKMDRLTEVFRDMEENRFSGRVVLDLQ